MNFECVTCGYIYDPKVGEPTSAIRPGIEFTKLPISWMCPTCGAEKNAFVNVEA